MCFEMGHSAGCLCDDEAPCTLQRRGVECGVNHAHQYKARVVQFDKVRIDRGNGTEPIMFDISELRRALRAAGVM